MRDDRGRFITSGIALGAGTTPYAKDILMATVAQLGQVPVLRQSNADGSPYLTFTGNNPTTQAGDVYPLATALRFFTQFADPNKSTYTWNDFLGQASDQFVAEKLAMYIGYLSEFNILKAQNPKADFEMSYLPQIRGYNTFSTGARVYGIATLKTTKNLFAALTTQSSFSGSGVAPSIAASIGSVPALRSYTTTAGLDEVISRSMLVASPWYDSFPAQSKSLVIEMIADVVNGRSGVNEAAQAFVARLQDLYTPR
jgi:ABC-type glycerol-3-phosphate transport system substrate-binding protein